MATTTPVTAEQLLRMPDDGCRCELVRGELRKMTPAGWKHGAVGGVLHVLLGRHVLQERVGRIFFADTGFLLARDPDTVRAPDIAFIRNDHLPGTPPEEAYWPGPPDLAVEVVSPGDTVKEIDDKVRAWLDAGAMMVWVVSPSWRTVTVYRSANRIALLTENEELSGEEVVAGFRCRVAEIFANL
jgi:Uma2 family endonuclease